MKLETGIHSVVAAIQNMLLKVYDLGLGTSWIGDIFYAYDALKKYFGKSWKLTAAITVGWSAQNPPPRLRKTVDGVTEFVSKNVNRYPYFRCKKK